LLFTRLRGDPDQAISTWQYRDPAVYSSHSLRRTKAAYIYEKTRNVEAVRELLGQSTISATSVYLNVGKHRALEIAKRLAM